MPSATSGAQQRPGRTVGQGVEHHARADAGRDHEHRQVGRLAERQHAVGGEQEQDRGLARAGVVGDLFVEPFFIGPSSGPA